MQRGSRARHDRDQRGEMVAVQRNRARVGMRSGKRRVLLQLGDGCRRWSYIETGRDSLPLT